MPSRASATILRATAVLLVAVLLAACSAQPESQARASEVAASAGTAAATVPPSGAPGDPPTVTPSEATATPEPTPTATPGIPPKPAKVTFKKIGEKTTGGKTKITYRVAWTAPEGVANAFPVYGVKGCLRESKQFDGKPCVTKGMKIPKGSLQLLAQAPGSARSIDVTWTVAEAGPGPYYAVLVRATNAAGNSIFTIAWSDTVCWGCTY